VGAGPPPLEVLAAAVVVESVVVVGLELLLPQPAASTEPAIATNAATKRRKLIMRVPLSFVPESWQPTVIMESATT
jgi:hypothetical protein